ncbi:MAG: hypothetical protein HQK71_01285 [Desulfamplus sp.]|nr:hypothetical protein [Desulfamplus sp.]
MAIENDIVLVYMEDSPIFFARIESIWADVKKDWFNIELLVLQIPLKVVVWTLKDIYINGTEFFMGGKKMRIEVVKAPQNDFASAEEAYNDDDEKSSNRDNDDNKGGGQVVSIAAFQKRKKESK